MNDTVSESPAPVPGSIVVGHDGSKDADTALEAALDLASKLDVVVVVSRAWSIDTAPRGALFDHGYVSSFPEVTEKVRILLVAETAEIAARHPAVALQFRASLANPVQLLTELSVSALMLVVGPRGLGGLAGLLLGSVSSQCVQLALCPVLVVPTRSG